MKEYPILFSTPMIIALLAGKQLSELQVKLGYMNGTGTLDNIAVLGFAGEAGEVINEIATPKDEHIVAAKLSQFSIAGHSLDFLKKEIRDGRHEQTPVIVCNKDLLTSEMADHLYYFNAICLNLGINFEQLAAMVIEKVKAKLLSHPEWKDKR